MGAILNYNITKILMAARVLLKGSLMWRSEASSSCGMALCHMAAMILYFTLEAYPAEKRYMLPFQDLMQNSHHSYPTLSFLQFKGFYQEKI